MSDERCLVRQPRGNSANDVIRPERGAFGGYPRARSVPNGSSGARRRAVGRDRPRRRAQRQRRDGIRMREHGTDHRSRRQLGDVRRTRGERRASGSIMIAVRERRPIRVVRRRLVSLPQRIRLMMVTRRWRRRPRRGVDNGRAGRLVAKVARLPGGAERPPQEQKAGNDSGEAARHRHAGASLGVGAHRGNPRRAAQRACRYISSSNSSYIASACSGPALIAALAQCRRWLRMSSRPTDRNASCTDAIWIMMSAQ